MAQITWRNVNQDTGIRDALAATTAAQNSFNGSLSALDKVLGQQQDIAQRGVDEQRLSNENAFLKQLQSRDPDAIRAAQANGTLDSLFGQLTAQQQNRLMPAQNTALAAAQGLQTADRQEITGDRTFATQELAYNMRHDLTDAERLGLTGDREKLKELVYRYKGNPDAIDLITKTYSNAAIAGEDRMLTVNEKRAKTNLANANVGLTNANTGLTSARTNTEITALPAVAAESDMAVITRNSAVADLNASSAEQGSIYGPNRGGTVATPEDKTKFTELLAGQYKGTPQEGRARRIGEGVITHVAVTVNGKEHSIPVPQALAVHYAGEAIRARRGIDGRLTPNGYAVENVNKAIREKMQSDPSYALEYFKLFKLKEGRLPPKSK